MVAVKRCKIGLWDENVPGIQFDEDGISNYARLQQHLMKIIRLAKGKEGMVNNKG